MAKIERRSGPSTEQKVRRSSAGYVFDEYADEWRLDGSVRISLAFLSEMGIEEETAAGFRQSLSRYAQELSASHCYNIRNRVVNFFISTESRDFSVDALSLFRASLADEHIWYLGVIRGFLDSWSEWGCLGLDKRSIKYLSALTLKGNDKGVAVLMNCPYFGPYTTLEHQSLLHGLANAYIEGGLSQHDYSFLLAVSMTGRRPVQIRYLKLCDLSFDDGEDGRRGYFLSIPRAKQRGEGKFRAIMKRILICKDLWDALTDQKNEVRSWVKDNIGLLDDSVVSQLPLFPDYERLKDCSQTELSSNLQTDLLHQTQEGISLMRNNLNRKAVAYSERTRDRLVIGFNRLRRTYATNLAIEGFGPMVIAEALDHSDTQQVSVYARPEKETAKQVSEVMAPVFAPLAMAFGGKLVESERDALRGDDPHSRVKLSTDVGVGSCGNNAFCADGWKACYVCRNFQPWLHAPHTQARDSLLKEREAQRKAGVSEKVIGASDRNLFAITQVIQLCNERIVELVTMEGTSENE